MSKRCKFHKRIIQYYCNDPCRICFCADCAFQHKYHIIRNLIDQPPDNEAFELKRIIENHSVNIENIQRIESSFNEMFRNIDGQQKKETEYIEKDYFRIKDLLKKKFLLVIQQIHENAKEEKERINEYNEVLNEIKKKSEKCIFIANSIIAKDTEDIIKESEHIIEFLGDVKEIPEVPNPRLSSFNLFQNINQLIDNINNK